MLKVLFDFIINIIYKYSRFFKTLLKKGFKFVLYKKSNFVLLNSSFVSLLIEVDFILKK